MGFPDFEKVATIFGFIYRKCKSNEDLEECIQWMVQSKKRVWLEIEQKLDDPVIPKVMSRIDENGKMQSPDLQDMYPFLSEEVMKELMLQ